MAAQTSCCTGARSPEPPAGRRSIKNRWQTNPRNSPGHANRARFITLGHRRYGKYNVKVGRHAALPTIDSTGTYVLTLRVAKAHPVRNRPGFCLYVRSAFGAGGLWPVQAILSG